MLGSWIFVLGIAGATSSSSIAYDTLKSAFQNAECCTESGTCAVKRSDMLNIIRSLTPALIAEKKVPTIDPSKKVNVNNCTLSLINGAWPGRFSWAPLGSEFFNLANMP